MKNTIMIEVLDQYHDFNKFIELLDSYKKVLCKKYLPSKSNRVAELGELLDSLSNHPCGAIKYKNKFINVRNYYYVWYALNNRELKLTIEDPSNIRKSDLKRVSGILKEFYSADKLVHIRATRTYANELDLIIKTVPKTVAESAFCFSEFQQGNLTTKVIARKNFYETISPILQSFSRN